MNIILLRLLEYLGHSNPYISGVSYTGVSISSQLLGSQANNSSAIQTGPKLWNNTRSAFPALLENVIGFGCQEPSK